MVGKKQKVVLDTCIYRGDVRPSFTGTNYTNLLNHLNASGGELLVSEIVEAEFSDYFKNELIYDRL